MHVKSFLDLNKSIPNKTNLLLLFIFILFSINTGFSQINNGNFRVDLSSTNMGPCGGSNDGVSTVGITAKMANINTFKIIFDLPDGVTYQTGTALITNQTGSSNFTLSEFDITDLNNPIFQIERPSNANWQVSDFVEFTFSKTAACEAVQYSYNGGLFKDAHTITYLQGTSARSHNDTDVTVNAYSFLSAYLAVEDITTENALVGQTTNRPITITNSGSGSIQSFVHDIEISPGLQSNYELSFNGTILTPSINGNIYTYQIDLNIAPFAGQVGDGDALFENENIVLNERLILTNCADNQVTRHSPKWGCSPGAYCQIGAQIPGFIGVDQEWSDIYLYTVSEPRPRWDAPVTYTYRLENDASADNAYDVNFNIGFTWDSRYSSTGFNPMYGDDNNTNRELSNFRFSGGTNFSPQRWPTTTASGTGLGSYLFGADFFTSDPDGAGGLEDLDGDGFYDDMLPGASTEISVDLTMLQLNPACDPYSATYSESLSLNLDTWTVNKCNNSNKTLRQELERHYVRRDALFNWEFPEDYDLDAEDGAVFNLNFIGGFVASNQSPTCNGIEMFSNDPSTIYRVVLDIENGITLDASADSRYVQIGNQIIFTETQLQDFEYNSYALRIPINFPLNIDCSTYSGPEELALNYTTSYESSCYDKDLHCGTFNITTHCPNGCTGPTTTSFDAHRTTSGWTDDSMSTKVTLDPNIHATKYYMAKDKMVVTSSAIMENSTQDNLHFEMRYVTDNGQSMADIITFTDGTITINDISTGIPQTFPITNSPVITTQGTNDNFFTLDLSSYQSLISGTYQYGEGLEADEISLELNFEFREDFPEEARLYEFHSFLGRFYSLDSSSNEVGCGTYNERAFFFQNTIEINTDINDSVNGCDEKWLYVGLSQASGVGDKFPDEFRPPLLWDNTTIQIPDGMQFNNLVSSYGYPNLIPENQDPASWNNGLNYSVSGNIVTITPGPRFTHLDQGGNYYPSVSISLTATSATPALSSHNISVTYDEYAYADSPVQKTESDVKDFNYTIPNYWISSDNAVEIGNSEIEGFIIDICKQDAGEINNNWLRVDTGTDYTITNAYLVNGATETPLTFTEENDVTYIQFGNMQAGNWICRKIRFEGTYTSSTPIDLRISHNYDCVAYPTNFSGIAFFHEEVFTLEPAPAAIQLQILSEPNTTVDTCTNYDIILEARNAGEADLISPVMNFDVPGDISAILINDIIIEYPRGSGNTESITPTITGNNVSVNLLDHTLIAANNGLVGSLNSANINEQIAIINLDLSPQCNYVSNTGTAYTVTGNNPYGTPATGSGSRTAANPIIITGAEPPYSTDNSLSITNTARLEGCTPETVDITTSILDGTTGTSDFVRIILPDGVHYVPSSFASTSALQLTYITTNTVGSHEEVELQLPQGATASDLLSYSFDITNQSTSCTTSANIDLTTYVTTDALNCNGVACGTTEIFTGDSAIALETFKSEIALSSITPQGAYNNSGSDYTYSIDFSIDNIGAYTIASGANYSVYCTDASDNKSGPAIYTGSLDAEILSGNTISETDSFTTTTFCGVGTNLLIELEPAVGNCFCNAVSFLISTTNDSADLSLSKSVSDTNPNIGDSITFTIDLTNNGPNDATNVSIQDIVPVGYTVNATSISNGGSITGNTITWNLATVTNGTTALTYEVSVNAPTGATDEYKNIAQVTASDQIDPDSTPNNDDGDQSEDDEDTVDNVTITTVDLSLDKQLAPTSSSSPNIGEEVTFEITVTNAGTDTATGIVIEDYIPIGLNVDASSISNGGTYAGNTITWVINSITPGDIILSYSVSINEPTGATDEYKNVAQVTRTNELDVDSTPDNYDANTPNEDDESEYTLTNPITDIAINKTASITTAAVGDQIVFTINTTNLGTIEATNIEVEEIIPNGFEFVSQNTTHGTYDYTIGSWAIPSLNSNESAELNLTVEVIEGTNYTNVARMSFVDQMDLNTDNDESEVTISVEEECLVIYNEFSPNNDDSNEFFFIECIENYPNNFLQIFNRWGTLVYETKGYNNNWDGTSEGRATANAEQKLPIGTYYYILLLNENQKEPKTGWLYITR